MRYLKFIAKDYSGWRLEVLEEIERFLAEEGYTAVDSEDVVLSDYVEHPVFFLALTSTDFPADELKLSYSCLSSFIYDLGDYPSKEIALNEFNSFYNSVTQYYLEMNNIRYVAKEKKDFVPF